MSKIITKLIAAALISVAVPSYASIASAAPTGGALAIKNAASSNIENVRWGWRGGWGWGRGWGVGAGIAAGALIGGALAAPIITAATMVGHITTRVPIMPIHITWWTTRITLSPSRVVRTTAALGIIVGLTRAPATVT